MTYVEVLTALADPTRRGLLERLRMRPHTVGELAALVQISQPAVSQHLRVLGEAQLVLYEAEGTRRFYRADRTGLLELRAYIESMWDDVLAAFAADDPSPPRASKAGKSKPKTKSTPTSKSIKPTRGKKKLR